MSEEKRMPRVLPKAQKWVRLEACCYTSIWKYLADGLLELSATKKR